MPFRLLSGSGAPFPSTLTNLMVEIAGARQPQEEGEDDRKMSGYFAVLLDSDNEDGPSTQNKDAKAKGKKDVAPAGRNDSFEIFRLKLC